MVILLVAINDIILMAIGGYSWSFYWWLLMILY
jgi:hypothetical protein